MLAQAAHRPRIASAPARCTSRQSLPLTRATAWPPGTRIGRRAGCLLRAELDRRPRRQEWPAALPGWPERPRRPGGRRLCCRRLVGLRLELLLRLVELRNAERAGIVAAGEAHQRVDARVDGGMGREQVLEALARVVDTHFHHGGG